MSEAKKVTIDLWLAVLFAAAAVCAIGVCTLIFFKWGAVKPGDKTAEMIEERETRLTDLESGMAKERSSYRWVSKDKGTVQLPIDRAMELTLQDLQNQQPRASGIAVNPAAAAAVKETQQTAETSAEEVAPEGEENPLEEAPTEETPVEEVPAEEAVSTDA